MEAKHESRSHGSGMSSDPLSEERCKGGPPRQVQEWPGRDSEMRPLADHGADNYVGGNKLQGRKALITGGDSGIGRAVAIAFAREGADVAISYYDEHDDADETLRLVRAAGRRGLALPGDLGDPAHCRRVVERTVQELGGLNVLVNNAAYHVENRDFPRLTPEQLERTFRVNVFAYVWLSQAAIEHMQAGDVILNSGSVVGDLGHPGLIDYAATKAADHNLTRSLAILLAGRGIRVNAVAPGPVWTPLIPATRDEDFVERFGADTAWGRPAQPVEIATSYVFLASADARFYTGQVLCPSGTLGMAR